MTQPLKITYLVDPTSSASGKYYISVESDHYSATIHGANTPGNGGRLTVMKSAAQASKKIVEKLRKNYNSVPMADVPPAALETLKISIAKSLSIPQDTIVFTDREVIFGTAGTGARVKPRRRNRELIDFWI